MQERRQTIIAFTKFIFLTYEATFWVWALVFHTTSHRKGNEVIFSSRQKRAGEPSNGAVLVGSVFGTS